MKDQAHSLDRRLETLRFRDVARTELHAGPSIPRARLSSRTSARALHAALASPGTRVVVLEGDVGTFCLGADFASLLAERDAEPSARAFASLLGELINAPKPIVAEVHGRAVAGGVGLAAAADLVVASGDTTFALTEALFGAVPSIVIPILLRRMRPAALTLWTLSSGTWSAEDARRAGLVDLCAPAGALERTTARWVRRLSRASADAIVPFRRCVNGGVAQAAADGVALTVERFNDPAVLGRVKAFVERGAAPWLEE